MANKEYKKPGLADYIEAGYPCMFLQTVESEVAEKRIRTALLDPRFDLSGIIFGIWKVTTGFRQGALTDENMSDMKTIDRAQDLIDALAYIETMKKPIAAIFHNLREYLRNPAVIQQLIDTILEARYVGSHIFLVGAYVDVPPELRSLITFVDCPMPTREQIQNEYTRMLNAYKEDLEIPKDKEKLKHLLGQAATAAVGLDALGAENALSLSLALTGGVDLRVIQSQKEQEVKKSDVLEFIPTEEVMDNVGGFKAFKEWMSRREKVFTDEARKYGLPYPKGVLICGNGGTGKSLVAKASAAYLKLPLLRLDMGRVFRSFVGASEEAIRQALAVAEAVSPVVLWLDEKYV